MSDGSIRAAIAAGTLEAKRGRYSIKTGFDPIAGAGTRLLVLGSLPGDRSLALGRYYGHPTNQFWRLMGAVLDEPLVDLDYPEKLEVLLRRRVGLWDVYHAAHRPGSSDTAIRDAATNDLGGLARTFPDLRAVAFNGGTAAAEGRRAFTGDLPFALVDLPSSSAANTAPFAIKLAVWAKLAPFLA